MSFLGKIITFAFFKMHINNIWGVPFKMENFKVKIPTWSTPSWGCVCYLAMSVLWFYAETKSIKLTQQRLKEHFNVARAPGKPTILTLVHKFLTTGSEMLDSLILTFWKEGIENVLVILRSFFDTLCFHIAVVHHVISILVKRNGI